LISFLKLEKMVVEKMNDLEEDGDAMDICNAGND
jgi:hypothetical protein